MLKHLISSKFKERLLKAKKIVQKTSKEFIGFFNGPSFILIAIKETISIMMEKHKT